MIVDPPVLNHSSQLPATSKKDRRRVRRRADWKCRRCDGRRRCYRLPHQALGAGLEGYGRRRLDVQRRAFRQSRIVLARFPSPSQAIFWSRRRGAMRAPLLPEICCLGMARQPGHRRIREPTGMVRDIVGILGRRPAGLLASASDAQCRSARNGSATVGEPNVWRRAHRAPADILIGDRDGVVVVPAG